MISDVASGLSVVMFPVLDQLGWLSYGAILVLAVLGAVVDPAGYTARKALIPPGRCHHRRQQGPGERASRRALHGRAGWSGRWPARSASPPSARCRPCGSRSRRSRSRPLRCRRWASRTVPASATTSSIEASPWHSARAGLSALLRDRPVWLLTIVVAVIWLLYAPTESVLLPVHFQAIGQAEAFGIVISAIRSAAWWAPRLRLDRRRTTRHRLARTCMLLAGITYVPLALLPSPWVMVDPALLLGLAWGPMEPLLNSVVQDRFPESQHGRIYGVQLSLLFCAPPLGQLISGAAVEAFGVSPVFLTTAGLLLAFVAGVAALPVLRRPRRRPTRSARQPGQPAASRPVT